MNYHNSEHAVDGDAGHLADLFGTPLLVMDEQVLRATMRRFRVAFTRANVRCDVVYAGKALMLQAIARLAFEEGLLLDVCSEGELHTALRAGVPAHSCIVHGCAKTNQELELAVRRGVDSVVVDHVGEIHALDAIAQRHNASCPVLVRINPGIAAATKAKIQTSAPGSKFGFPVNDGQALDAIRLVEQAAALEFRGLHCHIGSQIFDLQTYASEIEDLAAFAALVQREAGVVARVINVGGGLGVGDNDPKDAPAPEDWAATIFSNVERFFARASLPLPHLMVEPGRSIVAAAGATLYRVAVVKTLASGEQALIVDGGMSDNPRPALYEAAYRVTLASGKRGATADHCYTIFGRHCETDLLFSNVTLPPTAAGDVLAVRNTGAYTYSMASNYNRFPRPAVVLVNGTDARLIGRRESLEHLLDLDVAVDGSAEAAGGRTADSELGTRT